VDAEERERPDDPEDPDLGFVRVAKVEAWAGSGAPLNEFRSGDSLIVDVTFVAERPAPRFEGRIALREGSTLLHSTSTDRLGIPVGPLVTEARYRFTLANLPLAGGRYRVSVAAAPDAGSPPWHEVGEVAEVVVAPSSGSGPLAVQAAIEMA
jgi:hypothetical protein